MRQNPYVLLLSLALGTSLGLFFHGVEGDLGSWLLQISQNVFNPVGQIFLRLIFMVVVPLIFSALVLGVYELSQGSHFKAVALKTFGFTAITSLSSVLIGVTLVSVLRPGVGVTPGNPSEAITKIQSQAEDSKNFSQILIDLIPKNPLDAAVRAFDGEMIAFMMFSLIFGFALAQARNPQRPSEALISVLQDILETCLKIVALAMRLAPLAIFCLVFNSALKFGPKVFLALGYYAFVVVLGLGLQQFGVYSLLLKFFSKLSPLEFFRQTREVMIYAFATASSNATLPKSLETAENKLCLQKAPARFVLTVGATANQNGTALFEGITVLFLAQVYNIDLTLAQQVQVIAMSVLAGIGTAGVPGGSLPLIMILLQQVGIPPEGLGLILGVDRFLDMCRTAVNVTGDLVIATLVSGQQEANLKDRSKPFL